MKSTNYFKIEGRKEIVTFGPENVNRKWEIATGFAGGDVDKIWVWKRVEYPGPWWMCHVVGHRRYEDIVEDMNGATDPVEKRFYEAELGALLVS